MVVGSTVGLAVNVGEALGLVVGSAVGLTVNVGEAVGLVVGSAVGNGVVHVKLSDVHA